MASVDVLSTLEDPVAFASLLNDPAHLEDFRLSCLAQLKDQRKKTSNLEQQYSQNKRALVVETPFSPLDVQDQCQQCERCW